MDISRLHNLQAVCRICLNEKENMFPFITPHTLDMIEECTSVRESENEYLPQQICNNCYCQLQNAYQFKEQYILSIELLCEFLTSNNNPSIHSTERDSILSIRDKLRSTSKISQSNTTKVEKSIKNELKFEEVIEDIGLDCVEEDQYSDTDDVKPDWGNAGSPDNSVEIPDIKDDSLKPGLDDLNESEELEEGEIEFETDNNSNQKSLADILRQKYKIYDLTCNICNKELSTRATLLRHMDTHNKTRIFKHRCHICNKGFFDRGNLNKHLNRHAGKADYNCDKCDKVYYELSALAVHNKEKHKALPEQCDTCSLKFYHPLQLEFHKRTHEQKSYVCDVCGKVFNLKYKLKDHQIAHSEQRPYTCQFCQKGFKHKFTLTAHIKMRHEETKIKQMCFICGKLYVGGLAKHLESHDTTSENKCEICNRVYTTKSGLHRHINEIHNTDPAEKKRFTCEICNTTLGTKGTLTKHMAFVHSDVKKSCHICGKSYKRQINVDQHISAAHMDIRPFDCTLCPKAFYTRVLLRNHMRSHTGERPFACTVCGKAFGYREVLKTHMKIHNKIIQ